LISAINNSGESTENRENVLAFKAKFENLSDTKKGAYSRRSLLIKKPEVVTQNLVGLSL
jgi:hypothetical protein